MYKLTEILERIGNTPEANRTALFKSLNTLPTDDRLSDHAQALGAILGENNAVVLSTGKIATVENGRLIVLDPVIKEGPHV